jgi:YaiO family outer membrane protein
MLNRSRTIFVIGLCYSIIFIPTCSFAATLLKPHYDDWKLNAKPSNEIGFSQDEAYVSDLRSFWSYSSLHYYRTSSKGTFGGRINYANRFGIGGEQYQLEAYPKFAQIGYADLMFAYSNTSQRVFPQYQYRIEPYITLPKNLEASLGQYYLRSFSSNIYTYTASIAKTFSNNTIWFRPYYYNPKNVAFFELGAKHYFSDDVYLGVKAGAGNVPDIGDVVPFTQIVAYRGVYLGLNGQIPLRKQTFLRFGIGYLHQNYTTGLFRQVTDGSLEIIWRF